MKQAEVCELLAEDNKDENTIAEKRITGLKIAHRVSCMNVKL